jgi:PKD repeat protein
MVQSFKWDFGDGSTATTSGGVTSHVYTSNGAKEATVTVETTDGRTATGRTAFIISGI